ncbi:MAG: porphobilinogen synthase, partial [Candidatus Methylomirabilales bacterium]
MHFPMRRPRRLRRSETIRRMVRETALQVDDLIMPLFVVHGRGIRREIPPMPGNYQLSVDQLTREVKEIAALRIPAVLLFGIPERKDAHGSQAYAKDGIIQQAVRAIKDSVSDLLVITDTCLCEYTSHGHCGVVEEGVVTNDPTLELLAKTAVAQAEAGADIVAPSDMMDGRVGAIREALSSSGFEEVAIMSYAAKYAS